MQGFSIIICTYNPKMSLLERLFQSIKQLTKTDFSIEVILVDNNSKPEIGTYNLVQEFLKSLPLVSLINESSPGLTSARIAGIQAAKYDWLVFFDDDNEPTPDYLIESAKVIDQFPQVGAWGPGNVEVKYTDQNIPSWLNYYKYIFQQRNTSKLGFDNIFWWQDCYPYGTGFLLKKKICLEFKRRVAKNIYSLTDRKGKSLTSGGDMQMIYTGLLMGYFIGISPCIKINHLINKSKANQRYIARLFYGSAASNLPAYYQCFPEKYSAISYPSTRVFYNQLYYFCKVILFKEGIREFYFQLSRYLGELEGLILLEPDYRKPFFVKKLEILLGLK